MTTTEMTKVLDAMEVLAQISEGGIGEAGATMAEIEAAEHNGRCFEDNATYHVVQKAWILLDELCRESANQGTTRCQKRR